MKFLIFTFFLVTFQCVHAQLDLTSLRYFESNSTVEAKGVSNNNQEGVVVVGTATSFFGQSQYKAGIVCKSDLANNPIWQKVYLSFGDVFSFEHVLQLNDSSIVAFGEIYNPITAMNDGACLHLDRNGNLISKFAINDSTNTGSGTQNVITIVDAIADSDTSFVLTGNHNGDHSAFIIRTSLSGQIIWQQSFKDANGMILKLKGIARDSLGSYYAVGGLSPAKDIWGGVAIKLDSSGNTIWALKTIQSQYYFSDIAVDYSKLYIRNLGLQKNGIVALNLDGGFEWESNVLQGNSEMEMFPARKRVNFDNDSNLVISSNDISITYYHRFDRSGVHLDDKTFMGRSAGFAKGKMDTVYFLLSGPSFGVKNQELLNLHFAIVKNTSFDTIETICSWMGNLNFESVTSSFEAYTPISTVTYRSMSAMMEEVSFQLNTDYACVEFLGSTEEIESSISIFPNPASETLYISLPESTSRTDCILYDNLGKEVKRFLVSEGENQVEISELEKGSYICIIGNNQLKIIVN